MGALPAKKRAPARRPPRLAPPMPTEADSVTDIEPPKIEDADADNAMITESGDRFFPDDIADARIFQLEHGAMPEHPERWPWPEWSIDARTLAGVPTADLLAYCPTRGTCFPYGLPENAHHAACIHGEAFATDAE